MSVFCLGYCKKGIWKLLTLSVVVNSISLERFPPVPELVMCASVTKASPERKLMSLCGRNTTSKNFSPVSPGLDNTVIMLLWSQKIQHIE